MATDMNAAKSVMVKNTAIPSTKTMLQNSDSGIDFSDIIRKSGNRLENGLHLLSDRAGITGVSERTDNPPSADDYSYDENDTRNDNPRSRADTDDHNDHGQEHNASDDHHYTNDYESNKSEDYTPEMTEASVDKHTDAKNHSTDTQQNDHSDKNSEFSGQKNSEDGNIEPTNSNEASKSNGSDIPAEVGNKTIFSSLIANTQASSLLSQSGSQINKSDATLHGKSDEQTKVSTQNNSGGKGITDGLNIAMAKASMKTNSNSTNADKSGSNSLNTQVKTQSHNLTNTQGLAQTQNFSGIDFQAASEAQANASSKINEQAAQLSKLVGGGKKVDISVTITDEKSTLVSKPTTNLSSSTMLAADTSTISLRSKQGKSSGNANTISSSQQSAEQASGAAGQIQQAVGTQAHFKNTSSNNIKGVVQTSPLTVSAQGSISSSSETPIATTSNSVSAAQQAQQNTSVQAANSARFTTANHAVAEQVSIQITKALNAGNDKISIQLKPADLGRVDVQMEVGHDGRVTAVVTADNKQTLDLLQKDSKQLQEALQQAGLQADDDSLDFNLREQDDEQKMAKTESDSLNEDVADELTLQEELAGLKPNIITDTRIDVQA